MFAEKVQTNTQQIDPVQEKSKTEVFKTPVSITKKSASSKATWRKFQAESSLGITNEKTQNYFLNEKAEKIYGEVFIAILTEAFSGSVNKEKLEEVLQLTDELFGKEFDYSGEDWIYKAQAYSTRMMLRQMIGYEHPIEYPADEYLAFTDLLLANIDSFKRPCSDIHQDIIDICMPDYSHVWEYTKEAESFLQFNRALAYFSIGDEQSGIDALRASASNENRTALMAALMLRALTNEPFKNSTSTVIDQLFWQGSYQEYLDSIIGCNISDPVKFYDHIYAMRGISYSMLGDYATSLQEYEKAIQSYETFNGYPHPVAFDHHISLALIHYIHGDLDAAIEELQYIKEEPAHWPQGNSDWFQWKMTAERLEQVLRAQPR